MGDFPGNAIANLPRTAGQVHRPSRGVKLGEKRGDNLSSISETIVLKVNIFGACWQRPGLFGEHDHA